jgi:protein SCO1/2
MSRTLWRRIGIALLLLAGAGALYEVIAPIGKTLPVYMAIPPVVLVDQEGRSFDLNQTRGKVVLLSPIYTHCDDICPITTAKMKEIQDLVQSAGLSNEIQLVTFTVDPERDNSEVLRQFAEKYNASFTNWVFLTGANDQIQILIKTLGIYVERIYYVNNTPIPASALSNPPPGTFYLVDHTDRLFLIDRQGNVRDLPPGSRTNVDDTMRLIRQLVRN